MTPRYTRNGQPTIAYVVQDREFIGTHRAHLVELVRDAGWDVHIVSRPTIDSTVPLEGVCYHTVPLDRSAVTPWREPVAALALRRLYERLQPDICHHITFKPIVLGAFAVNSILGKSRVVNDLPGLGHMFTRHGFKERVVARVMMGCYRYAFARDEREQVVIVENRADAREIQELGESVTVRVGKGSGVDTNRFTCPSPGERPTKPPIVGYVGRLLRKKGVVDFVRAARLLSQRGVDAEFVVAGSPDPENASSVDEETVQEWILDGAINYVGWQEDVETLLRRLSVLCLPTRYREGVPKVLLEAGASCCAMIVSDVESCRTVVDNGVTGVTIPVGSVTDLSDAIEHLVASPSLRRDLGEAARRKVARKFSVEAASAEFIRAYTTVWPELTRKQGSGSARA